jgi:hypothetical protein
MSFTIVHAATVQLEAAGQTPESSTAALELPMQGLGNRPPSSGIQTKLVLNPFQPSSQGFQRNICKGRSGRRSEQAYN